MKNWTWDGIYLSIREFFYEHTELAIWIGLSLLVAILFWLMIYSVAIRRFVAVFAVLTAVSFYLLSHYGIFDAEAFLHGRPQPLIQ